MWDNRARQITENSAHYHGLLIHNYGGASGILCQGTVDYLTDQINAESDCFRKAALTLHIVITCHPFMDGNKRTAFQIADLILSGEGYFICAEEDRIIQALVKIARYECGVENIEEWLKRNIERL